MVRAGSRAYSVVRDDLGCYMNTQRRSWGLVHFRNQDFRRRLQRFYRGCWIISKAAVNMSLVAKSPYLPLTQVF